MLSESCGPSSQVTLATQQLSSLIQHVKASKAEISLTMSVEVNHDIISDASSLTGVIMHSPSVLMIPHFSLPIADDQVNNNVNACVNLKNTPRFPGSQLTSSYAESNSQSDYLH